MCDKNNYRKIRIKNEALANARYKRLLRQFSYNSPSLSEMIISSQKEIAEVKQKENSTFLDSNSEDSFDKSSSGPIFLIDDKLFLGNSQMTDGKSDIEDPECFHIHFPATTLNSSETRMVYFANRGSCIIRYLWKV